MLNVCSMKCFIRWEYRLSGVSQILDSTGPMSLVCIDMYWGLTPSSTKAPDASTLRENYVLRNAAFAVTER